MEIKFTICDQPITKKNSQRMVMYRSKQTGKQRMIPMPSAQYEKYKRSFVAQLNGMFRRSICDAKIPIDQPVNLKCVYYMATKRKVDLCNLIEATCDILVDAELLADDNCSIVASHDGSRVLYDKTNPRVEIEITDAGGTD